jgi:hypothetical protein
MYDNLKDLDLKREQLMSAMVELEVVTMHAYADMDLDDPSALAADVAAQALALAYEAYVEAVAMLGVCSSYKTSEPAGKTR